MACLARSSRISVLPSSGRYHENFDLSLTARAIEVLEPAVRAAAGDEFDEYVAREILEFANDLRARLQHIARGSLQYKYKEPA